MDENKGKCFSLPRSLFSISCDNAMFHPSTGESLKTYKFPNPIASSERKEHRQMKSVRPAVSIQLTS